MRRPISSAAMARWCAAVACALPLVVSNVKQSVRAEEKIAKAPAEKVRAGKKGAEGARISEFEHLRALEEQITAVITRCAQSFVFLQGGSGFVISEDGYVLTNEHVVASFSTDGELVNSVNVYLRGGRKIKGDVVGHNPDGDLALIRLHEPPGVPALEFGNSDAVEIGQTVIALGDPFLVGSQEIFFQFDPIPDFEPSASVGIVSALHRYSKAYTDAIQVDAAVNPGNSGGPLLTLEGKVIGINGKIENPYGVGINHGIGYAIPSNQARRFVKPLREAKGDIVRHGTIHGVEMALRRGELPGLPVVSVVPGSYTDRLGIRAGDRFLEVAGYRVPTSNRYLGVLGAFPAGSVIPLRIARGSDLFEKAITLFVYGKSELGVKIAPAAKANTVKVAMVDDGKAAALAGIRTGDVIRRFADQPVHTTEDLKKLIGSRAPGEEVNVTVSRDGNPIELTLLLGRLAQ